MATYSSILLWRIPRTEEPEGRLQSMGLQRVVHDCRSNDWCPSKRRGPPGRHRVEDDAKLEAEI